MSKGQSLTCCTALWNNAYFVVHITKASKHSKILIEICVKHETQFISYFLKCNKFNKKRNPPCILSPWLLFMFIFS